MAFQFLKTKLDIPTTRKNKLPRPKLANLLGDSTISQTILVSAPAGYGKTSAIVEWTKTRKDHFAWITLDETDNDPIRFYGYLKEALKKIHPEFGKIEDHLSSYPLVPLSTSLTILLNSLAEFGQPLFIVLDDYHAIANPEVHEVTRFLIQHLAVGINIIISTRQDPPLPLDQWRVKGSLLEVRQSDLCFSKEDVSILLNQIMRLNLTDGDISNLNDKTEGWIAGLHIAALFLSKQQDKTAAISGFTGNHTHIMNYLVTEVLSEQPENMRHFLLESSILEDLSAGQCDVVTQRLDSRQLLEQLYGENQFIMQMDGQHQRYRFHQLFRDVLRNLLEQQFPEKLTELYLRASCWYEENNQLEEAIKLAFKGGNLEKAVELIKRHAPNALEKGERATTREWMERLPEEIIRESTILNLMHAWSVMNDRTAAADAIFKKRVKRAEEIERSSRKNSNDNDAPGNALTENLSDTITLIKAIYAFENGEPSKLFLPALQRMLNNSEDKLRSAMVFLMAHIQIRTMELDMALDSLDDAISLAQSINYIYLATYSTYLKAWILLQTGKTHQAVEVCEEGLKNLVLSKKQAKYTLPITSCLKIMIAAVYYEWNRLEEAEVLLDSALVPLKETKEIGIITFGIIKQVIVKIAIGKEKKSIQSYITNLSMMDRYHKITAELADTMQAELFSLVGNVLQDAEEAILSDVNLDFPRHFFEEEMPYYQNYDWILLRDLGKIRMFLDRCVQADHHPNDGTLEKLTGFLTTHVKGCNLWGLVRLEVEVLTTLAAVYQLQGDNPNCLETLTIALNLAVPAEFIRMFICQIKMIARPLRQLRDAGRYVEFIGKILEESGIEETTNNLLTGGNAPLNNDLSLRELEVLKLIAEGHTNQGISSELFISLNTVKSHVSHIFGKLGVNRRTKAVSAAKKLGIL